MNYGQVNAVRLNEKPCIRKIIKKRNIYMLTYFINPGIRLKKIKNSHQLMYKWKCVKLD